MKFPAILIVTHDIECALIELGNAAKCWVRPLMLSSEHSVTADLAGAAVAFVVQLAIEVGRDPTQMRALESELIEALGRKAAWE